MSDLPVLEPEEQRILGSLLEKQTTVPASYPLTANALRTACNQTSNRDPVVDFDQQTVERTARALKERGLLRIVWSDTGRRTLKYHQILDEQLGLEPDERALLTVLLLRGAQAPGELRILSQGVLGNADQLGLRRRDVPGRQQVAFAAQHHRRRGRKVPLCVCRHRRLKSLMEKSAPAIALANRWPDRLAVAVLAALALIAAFTFRDYGLGWDDFTHAQYGDLLLSLYTSGFHDVRALSFVNLYLYGGGFDMAAALLAKVLPLDLFETRRLLGAAIGIAGLAITWRIGRRVGGPVAGLVALVLLAACPLYYGHMFINAKDAPFAAAMALFLLGLVRLLDQYPRPCFTTLFIIGFGFGLSIGSRILAGFGVLEALGALALLIAIEARNDGLGVANRRIWHVALLLIPSAVLAYAVMALIWPWGAASPLNPVNAIEVFSHFFEKPWHELFEGALIEPPDMPRRYVLVLLGAKLPELFLLLGCFGVLGALIAAFRREHPPRAARSISPSRSPRSCRSPSPSSPARRCTTVSVISSSCCRRLPFSAGSPPHGCSVAQRTSAGRRRPCSP